MVRNGMGCFLKRLVVLVGVFCSGLNAQSSPTIIALDSVTVRGFKIPKEQIRLPFTVAKANYAALQDQQQQLSLAEYLEQFPGVFSLNSNNFAQDLRVAIRGFGARSAFGIRGIKIIVDGIPETTPDGQGQVDNLNLGMIETIEILKGGAAPVYGNASGGVLAITTQENLRNNFVQPALTLGSFGFQNTQIQGGYQASQTLITGYLGQMAQNGFRDHSRFENIGLHLKVKHHINEKEQLTFLVNYAHSPEAQDPGGITAKDVMSNRQQARQQNIDYQAGESVDQLKLGTSWQRSNGPLELQSYLFYTTRDFLGRLPFANGGIVDLDRQYAGMGGSLRYNRRGNSSHYSLRLGIDAAGQQDQRRRFMNQNGAVGALTLDQKETYATMGVSLLTDWQWRKWTLMGGLRFDQNRLGVTDRFLDDGLNSDQLFLPAWNYSFGVNYQGHPQHRFFVNTASTYETPVLSELSANPDGVGGFNTELLPQQSQTLELGYDWEFFMHRLAVRMFLIDSREELVPYELETNPGRTFYRNAGKSERKGVEFSYQAKWGSHWFYQLNYTYSDFRYREFVTPNGNYSGRQLPGLPRHYAHGQVRYLSAKGLSLRLTALFRGALFADDANMFSENGVSIFHLDAAYPLAFFPKAKLAVGLRNLTQSRYSDNIRLNAFGQRFFEPAPGRTFYGGVRILL